MVRRRRLTELDADRGYHVDAETCGFGDLTVPALCVLSVIPCAVRQDRRCLDRRFLQRRCSSRRRRDRRLREPLTRAAGARTGEDYNISAQSASLTPEVPVRTTGPGTWQGRPTAWEAQGRFFGPIAHFVFSCAGPNDIRLVLTLARPLSICLLPAARSSEAGLLAQPSVV